MNNLSYICKTIFLPSSVRNQHTQWLLSCQYLKDQLYGGALRTGKQSQTISDYRLYLSRRRIEHSRKQNLLFDTQAVASIWTGESEKY